MITIYILSGILIVLFAIIIYKFINDKRNNLRL